MRCRARFTAAPKVQGCVGDDVSRAGPPSRWEPSERLKRLRQGSCFWQDHPLMLARYRLGKEDKIDGIHRQLPFLLGGRNHHSSYRLYPDVDVVCFIRKFRSFLVLSD
jgi:hypothetical protein